MADLWFKIKADTSELDKAYKSLSEVEKLISNFNKKLSEAEPGGKKFKEISNQLTTLEKDYDKAIKKIGELENSLQSMAEAKNVVSQTKEITDSTNEATKVFVKYAGSIGELDKRVKDLTKEYLSMNAAQKASTQGQSVINEIAILNSQRKIEADSLRALQKEYVNTQKMQDLQEGSIVALRAELSKLTASYDGMDRSMRNGSIGKELLGSIQNVTQELNEAEQASMRFNRNVGNYASGWNGLNVQVQQVARELPSLAIGANTFFLAISNNLPMLADELKRAKTEYKAFVAEGKAATPVWKQVLSSLFSWQTALVAGITILSVYGKEIISWVGSLFTAKKALSETYQSLEDYQKKVGETSGSVIVTLERLSNGWKRLGGDIDAQKKYIIDNKDAIDSMGVSVTDAAEAERLFNSNKDAFIQGILQRAQATAIMELAAEEYKKSVQKMMEADAKSEEGVSFGDKFKSWFVKSAATEDTSGSLSNADLSPEAFAKDKVDKLRKEADEYKQSMLDLIYKAMGIDEESRKKIEEAGGKLTQTIVDGSIEAIEAAIAFKQQSLKKVTDPQKYKQIEAEIKAEQAKLRAITGEKEKGNVKNYIDSYAQSKEIKRSSQDIKDTLIKSELDIQQQQIDLEEEGSKKQLAQIRLNYDKRYQEIAKEERELLQKLQDEERKQWEKDNPKFKEKNLQFTPTITKLPEEAQGKFGTQYSLAYQQQEKDANNLLKNLLDKYQDYATQRLDIEKKFNDDIAILEEQRKTASKNGDTQQVETVDRAIAQATTNKGKALIGHDYEQLKQSPDYVRAFENLKQTSSETLNSLLSQLENAKTSAAEVLSPDQLREYTTTIQSIMDELDSRNPFQALADRKKELAEAEEELAEAKRNLDTVNSGGKVASGTKLNEKTGKIDTTYMSSAQALEKYNKAKDKSVKADAKVKKAEKEVTDVVGELSKSIKEVGDAIGGSAGEIISLIGDIGLFAMTAMSGVSTASTTASKSIQAVEKASVILAIIGAAIQIAMKIASLFKDDDGVAAYEKAKGVYESYIDILDRVIEKQKELFELNSKTGEQAYEKAKETVKKQENASRELGKQYLNSGASKGFLGIGSSASEGVKQRDDMSSKALNEAKKVLGRDYNKATDGRMTGLFDMSAKQLADLQRDAPLFWAELHDDTQKYLQQIIDCNEELTKLEQDRMEGLVKTDFSSFSDSFLDMLTDLDSSSQDFADNFEKYLQNAILTSLITDKYKSNIEALYKQWADDTESGNKLTEDEAIALRKKQEELANSMLEERNQLMKDFGWTSGESTSQNSTKGGFQAMSQDTGSELNGRFTALQIAGEEIKNQNIEQTSLLSSINEKMSALCTTPETGSSDTIINATSPADGLHEILTMGFAQRDGFSGQIVEQLVAVKSEVSGLKDIVDEMRTFQVEKILDTQEIREGIQTLAKNSPKILTNSEDIKRSCKSFAGQ